MGRCEQCSGTKPRAKCVAASLDSFVGACIARPCREAASRERRGGCTRPYAPPHQRPPYVKGPQGSAACGRTSDRSGPAAACLGGPQRGPGRLSGTPGLSAARLTGGLSTPPALRATSPYTGEALGRPVRRRRPGVAARRAADSRPYGGIAGWCVCRRRSVGADAFIGPHPPQADLFGENTQAMRLGCLRRGTFHRRKVPKMRRGLRPRSPTGPRGVHLRERHCPSCYAPPGCPVPYCLPLLGYARASKVGQLLRLRRFSLRPHGLPWNTGLNFARGSVTTPQSRLCRDSSPYTGEPWAAAFGGARYSVLAISPAAAMIWSISSTVCAAERNMASNWLGAA